MPNKSDAWTTWLCRPREQSSPLDGECADVLRNLQARDRAWASREDIHAEPGSPFLGLSELTVATSRTPEEVYRAANDLEHLGLARRLEGQGFRLSLTDKGRAYKLGKRSAA